MGRHPFAWIPESRQRLALGISLAAAFFWTLVMAVVSAPLESEVAPGGIVDFEFAGSAARAAEIMGSWSAPTRDMALLGMGLDYLYLVLYPIAASMLCVAIARRLVPTAPKISQLGVWISWWVLLSGLFDAIENYGLIRQLLDGPADAWARLAWGCAAAKFGLLALALLYLSMGLVALIVFARTRHD